MKTFEKFFSFWANAVLINLFWKTKLISSIFKFLNTYDKNMSSLISMTLCCEACFFWQFFSCWNVFDNFSIISRLQVSTIMRFCQCRLIISICLTTIFWLNFNYSCKLIMTFLFSKVVNVYSTELFKSFLNVLWFFCRAS